MQSRSSTISAIVSAAPSGQFWPAKNLSWIRLPIIRLSGPPSSWALMKSPIAGRKTSARPAYAPARVAGTVTVRKVRSGEP